MVRFGLIFRTPCLLETNIRNLSVWKNQLETAGNMDWMLETYKGVTKHNCVSKLKFCFRYAAIWCFQSNSCVSNMILAISKLRFRVLRHCWNRYIEIISKLSAYSRTVRGFRWPSVFKSVIESPRISWHLWIKVRC